MRMLLTGGQWLEVSHVRLHDEPTLMQVRNLRAQAARALGGSGLAVGVAGPMSWTLAGEAAALGIISGILAGAARKQAMQQLTQAAEIYRQLLGSGVFFPIGEVRDAHLPSPDAWWATRGATRHVHSGEDFLWVYGSEAYTAVRWTAVSAMTLDPPEQQVAETISLVGQAAVEQALRLQPV